MRGTGTGSCHSVLGEDVDMIVILYDEWMNG